MTITLAVAVTVLERRSYFGGSRVVLRDKITLAVAVTVPEGKNYIVGSGGR